MKQALLLLFFLPFSLFSQEIKGKVVDTNTNLPVTGIQIIAIPEVPVSIDNSGNFTVAADSLPVTLIFEATGYSTLYLTVQDTLPVLVLLVPEKPLTELDLVVVTAARRKQRIEEVTISLDVLKPELINNKGITDLEQAVEQSPGVYSMDGQVSIRGGSGFAYGAGSRVLVVYNDMPLISADAGDAKWNAIPIENAAQIEVIKGASSVLYGSGALNGIVSLTEREPTAKPYLFAKIQTGIYDDPKRSSLKWWNKNPTFQQADLSFGKQWKAFGMNISGYGYTNDGYRQGETEDRGRLSGTFFYKPGGKLQASLGYSAQLSKAGNFLIWQSDTFAYQPSGGADTSLAASTLTYNRGLRMNIDPTVKYTDRYGNRHQLKGRYYLTDNKNYNNLSQSSKADVKYINYQFTRTFSDHWILTSGAAAIRNDVRSYLYGNHNSLNLSAYAQGEFSYKKLDVTAGVRFEYFEQDGRQGDSDFYFGKDSKLPVMPVFRAGAHYELFKFTHLRASFGQGVRYPSVAERYTTTSVGGLNIFANPDLLPEQGWAAEIGIKQGIKVSNWKGYFDVAGFVNHYSNMMEFAFGIYNPDSIPLSYFDPDSPGYVGKWVGFQAQNAEEATITGIELSFTSEGSIGPVKLQSLMGYTYMNPVTNNTDSLYLSSFSDSVSRMLKYRFRHLAKIDLQATYKGVSLGASMRYNSFMENVDAIFEDGFLNNQILPGLKRYRQENNGGNIVFDARIGYEFLEHYRFSFIVNNLANAEMMGRPGDIQAPRSFIVQFQYKL